MLYNLMLKANALSMAKWHGMEWNGMEWNGMRFPGFLLI
jgi:hypothetical protein